MHPSPQRPPRRTAIALGFAAAVVVIALLYRGNRGHIFGPPPPPPVIITTGTVQDGDVFGVMLARSGLKNQYISPVSKAFSKQLKLELIQPNKLYEIITSTSGEFQKFIYKLDEAHSYVVTRSSNDVYESAASEKQTVWIEKRVSVEINKFLDADLRAAGYDTNFIGNLVGELTDRIFGWRVDFFTEQRRGDKLDVLMEEEYLVGEDHPMKGGTHMRVIAASYMGSGTRNKENYAIRYQAPGDRRPEFYDPDGKAMRRAFLRAPFTTTAFHVSSGFNNHRFHPILRIYRPHHGTDYAAAIGTPVCAIGKGTVVRAEWFKGYGNCVDIRHNDRYTSRYGHLSKILVHRGQPVDQGRLIGRVGNTGLSTGPHLHFEMLVDGTQRNFLTMSFPASSAVSKDNMPDFMRVRDEALARLNAHPAAQNKQLTMNLAAR